MLWSHSGISDVLTVWRKLSCCHFFWDMTILLQNITGFLEIYLYGYLFCRLEYTWSGADMHYMLFIHQSEIDYVVHRKLFFFQYCLSSCLLNNFFSTEHLGVSLLWALLIKNVTTFSPDGFCGPERVDSQKFHLC